MVVWLIILLAVVALLITVIYFRSQGRRPDDTWQSFRKRHRQNHDYPATEQSIDPIFQFDQPTVGVEKEKPDDPRL